MFFPFDPYLLRRSARFLDLATSYNTWGGAHQHGTDASHISSDDELEVPDGEIEQEVSCLHVHRGAQHTAAVLSKLTCTVVSIDIEVCSSALAGQVHEGVMPAHCAYQECASCIDGTPGADHARPASGLPSTQLAYY